MTATLPLSPLACWLIGTYQRYLSPRKGFRCAYRARHKRRSSCSQFARRAINRLGLLPGIRLLRRRFEKCHHAKRVLDYRTPRREEKKPAPQGSSWSAGDCVSGCDPGVPVDVCDGVTALADVAGGAASGAGDLASGLAEAAACDAGCCDISV
jgi:putative component of membrane protein insertase Oxa1/YidC/SpoIIIJ protein YidD